MLGNSFAYLSLLLWPILSLLLFRTKSIEKAILYTFLGGFLFLPVKTSIDLPLLPAFDKYSISTLIVIFGCLVIRHRSITIFKGGGLPSLILVLLLFGTILTVLTNSDGFFTGASYIPGMTNHDALSVIVNQFIAVVPFFIGARFFRTYESQLLILKSIVACAFLYSFLILFEIRFSPQLHNWIYGYFPHAQFSQQIRFGGFRPVVFIGHGLAVAMFIVVSLIALHSLKKYNIVVKKYYNYLYLSVILILCKSIAPLLYGIFAFLSLKFFDSKKILLISLILSCLTFSYPLLKMTNSIPTEKIINLAAEFDSERAGSLEFRMKNEDILLEKADQRALFGWGGWGRNRVYDNSGKDISVTDGLWIIYYGQYGAVGFLSLFSLMMIPICNAFMLRKKKHISNDVLGILASHSLILALLMFDQILNASLNSFYWLIAGALYGRARELKYSENMTNAKE